MIQQTTLRIGLFHATLPEPDRKPGGVEVHVHRLAGALAERGHHVRVYSMSSAPGGASYDHAPIALGHRLGRLGRMFALPMRLNDLNVEDLDLLHLHGDDWFYSRRSIPTIRTFHGSALSEARFASGWRRRASQLLLHGMEQISGRRATAAYGLTPAQAHNSHLVGSLTSGIDLPPAVRKTQGGPPSVLFVGTWEGRKRGKLLQRVFCSEIRPRVPGVQLWMVSDRCEEAEGVIWFPRPSDEELAELYRRASLFCLPSLYEGFGIPYLEAMAHGAPVVATPNVGSQYLLEEGSSGAIAHDAELASTLTDLLGDEARRAALTRRGYRRAAQFSWDQVAATHESAYLSAIADWQARGQAPRLSRRLRPAQ
jgi:phosphatidyl-myo-inositol alpha-mannosyltransferase